MDSTAETALFVLPRTGPSMVTTSQPRGNIAVTPSPDRSFKSQQRDKKALETRPPQTKPNRSTHHLYRSTNHYFCRANSTIRRQDRKVFAPMNLRRRYTLSESLIMIPVSVSLGGGAVVLCNLMRYAFLKPGFILFVSVVSLVLGCIGAAQRYFGLFWYPSDFDEDKHDRNWTHVGGATESSGASPQ